MPPTFPSTAISSSGFFTGITISYLPLYVFCDDFPLIARLRPSSLDACDGTEEILVKLVGAIRARYPDVRFRGDSGFCRESILKQCEILKIKYITGMTGNNRLLKKIDPRDD